MPKVKRKLCGKITRDLLGLRNGSEHIGEF